MKAKEFEEKLSAMIGMKIEGVNTYGNTIRFTVDGCRYAAFKFEQINDVLLADIANALKGKLQ
jgi:hypothetical protein